MRVVVLGAGGYVGSRLVPRLLERGYAVTATFTDPARAQRFPWADQVTIAGLDVLDRPRTRDVVAGADAVAYLVHGLAGPDFSTADREGAYNAAHAAVRAGVERLVYLGGLVPDVPEPDLSPHLRSRLEVEGVLGDSGVPTLALRAAMVVGSGSTSFEVMRHLSRRLPVQAVPTWMRSRVEPVAVTDVVAALVGALEVDPATRSYDVGSGETMSYAALLRLYARLSGTRALQVPAPFLPTAVVARVAPWFTDVPSATVRSLVASLRHDMVCRERDFVADLVQGSAPMPVAQAIRRALAPAPVEAGGDLDPLGPFPTDPPWSDAEGVGRAG